MTSARLGKARRGEAWRGEARRGFFRPGESLIAICGLMHTRGGMADNPVGLFVWINCGLTHCSYGMSGVHSGHEKRIQESHVVGNNVL